MNDMNHRAFLRHLAESKSAVQVVADWLLRVGPFCVGLNRTSYAPDRSQWRTYIDNGDLYFTTRTLPHAQPQDWVRVEVKHRSLNFTRAEDYPYGDLIVCAKHAYEQANPKPEWFVIVNAPMSHAAVVLSETRDRWHVAQRTDRRYHDVRQECLHAPMECVYGFYRIEEEAA